ncbi:hypothetical protein K7X08_003971 [Anisodus acutangulus]|uniref:Hydrophobic seed protein domain-containing protein n=1 Tax=Anisodus acutangulus TaxID=402998 RepID=A0A9Q1MGP6_9SOLA|nr:hypothetical protein K7X08_003971 [Anisodus acutangulus]
MESSKTKIRTLLFIFILLISSFSPIFGCGHCKKHKKKPIIPPVNNNPSPPAESSTSCPIDTIKLGACVDLLGGLVHIGIGNPVVNECCPIIQGLVELEAAVCLYSTSWLHLLFVDFGVRLQAKILEDCVD